jgi:DNA-binding CsgD family transcriptional regulator
MDRWIHVVRTTELATLHRAFAAVCRYLGAVAIVDGPGGSGTAALCHAFAGQASAAGALVLTATCARSETTLPLGVVSQLVHSSGLPAPAAAELAALADGWRGATPQPGDPDTGQRTVALSNALRRLADDRPLVVVVDDVQYADADSLRILLHLCRRLRTSRIMILLNEWRLPRPVHAALDAELTGHPHAVRIRLGRLTASQTESVARLTTGQLSSGSASELHAISNGNVFLLQGLIADRLTGRPQHGQAPPLADSFSRAVLGVLHSRGSSLPAVARGATIVDAVDRPALLAELVQIDPQSVREALQALTDAGLLNDGRFHHDAVRAVIEATIAPRERVDLHLRAAGLLRDDGAAPAVVAGHLVAAGEVPPNPWAHEVLLDAAEQALDADTVEPAVHLLRLAQTACADPDRRASITAKLIHAEWRLDPSGVARHLTCVRRAVEQGHLDGPEPGRLMRYLLWHGRIEEATKLVRQRVGSAAAGHADMVAELRLTCPGVIESDPPLRAVYSSPDDGARVGVPAFLKAASAFTAVLSAGPSTASVRTAHHLLQECRFALDDNAMRAIHLAVWTLIHADRLSDAERWCALLFSESVGAGSAPWRAELTLASAEIALRRGDVDRAVSWADSALSRLSPQGWASAIGGPLSTALLANVAAGRLDAATALVQQGVPRSTLRTTYGLRYRYAHGRYLLETRRPYLALTEFTACGDLMTAWGVDYPSMVPWRAAAAEANLILGWTRQARKLVETQLAMPNGGGPRVRGSALRVLASTSAAAHRPRLLRESIDLLRESGDQLELARAQGDLSNAYRQLGEPDKARTVVRSVALTVHRGCDPSAPAAVPASRRFARDPGTMTLADPGEGGVGTLSSAERRVARLAALGQSNREISRALYITVSTVEQHLTRVYRKLKVNRRSHLPAELTQELPAEA